MNKNASSLSSFLGSFVQMDDHGEMSGKSKVISVGVLLALSLFIIWLIPDPPEVIRTSGWHVTVFPYDFLKTFRYFSLGLVLLQITLLSIRGIFKLEGFYTIDRMEILNWLILIFGTFVGGVIIYASVIEPMLNELFLEGMKFYIRVNYFMFILFWVNIILQFLPQLLWAEKNRRSIKRTFWICVVWWAPFLLEKLVLAVSYMWFIK